MNTEPARNAVEGSLDDLNDQVSVSSAADCATGSRSGLESATALVALRDACLASALQSLGAALRNMPALLNQTREGDHSAVALTRLADDVADIAAQSGLLALNAAIEAAWVGEAQRTTGISA